MSRVVDISAVIESQRVSRFTVGLVAWSALLMFFDGYDLVTMSFAAPAVVRTWQIERASLGVIFSAGLLGMLFGGLAFGVLGDRIGRKPAILATVVLLGLFSLLTAFATTTIQLLMFRFGTGVAIGGIYPAAYALNIEMVPQRFRASVIMLITVGFSMGGVAGGLVSAWLIPVFGWQLMFWVGGACPMLLLPAFALVLPESIRFLVLRGRPRSRVHELLRRMDIAAVIPADARSVLPDETHA
jgi:AAHS family 4-hydroxybenzoate transporter-like MFS transporter